MQQFLEVFAQFGLPGLVIGLQFVWIWRGEKRIKYLTDQLSAEQKARVDDAKRYTDLALKIQNRVFSAVETIGGIMVEGDDDDAVDSGDGS
jgi:hypothetical protein